MLPAKLGCHQGGTEVTSPQVHAACGSPQRRGATAQGWHRHTEHPTDAVLLRLGARGEQTWLVTATDEPPKGTQALP